MTHDGETPAAVSQPPRWQFRAVTALVYLAGMLLSLVPGAFLALGIQELGDRGGWWVGDPNSNDGEEVVATAIGIIGILLLLALVAVALRQVSLVHRVRFMPLFGIGLGAILLALVLFCVWWISATFG
jgi:hypothetical protein